MKNKRRPLSPSRPGRRPLRGRGRSGRHPVPPPGRSRADQKTIVIDPGHGGLDVGAKGKFGSLEKTVTLAISLKLKALIEQNMAYRVILTRDKDIDVSLENRSALANNNDAVVFISIHANGSFRTAPGAETFFMSLNASTRRPASSPISRTTPPQLEKQIADETKDDVKMILWDMAQSAYIKQSARLAEAIQQDPLF